MKSACHVTEFLAAFILIGCGTMSAINPAPKPDPIQPRNSEAELYRALADRIEQCRIADTDELLRIVREAKRDGDILDMSRFAAAFPKTDRVPFSDATRKEAAEKLRKL